MLSESEAAKVNSMRLLAFHCLLTLACDCVASLQIIFFTVGKANS